MIAGELDGFLDVRRRPSIHADDRHAPLLTREAKRGVEITALDSAIRECVRLPVGVFSGARLIRTPDTVEPASLNLCAVP